MNDTCVRKSIVKREALNADDARQDHAGILQLEEDPQHADHHEDVRDVGIGDEREELVAESDLDPLRRAGGARGAT